VNAEQKIVWQRGRIIRYQGLPELVGRLVWVSGEPMTSLIGSIDVYTGLETSSCHRVLKSNLIYYDGLTVDFNADIVELLPEFSDAEEMVSWRDWLADKSGT
jgi:hypothetical protein